MRLIALGSNRGARPIDRFLPYQIFFKIIVAFAGNVWYDI